MTIICGFTTDPDIRIVVAGKEYRFDFSDRFGPLVLGADGQPLENQPGPRSPFWMAATTWVRQGKHVDAAGLCIWCGDQDGIVPNGYKLVHMGGRHYQLMEKLK